VGSARDRPPARTTGASLATNRVLKSAPMQSGFRVPVERNVAQVGRTVPFLPTAAPSGWPAGRSGLVTGEELVASESGRAGRLDRNDNSLPDGP
jgi:hypothetical protein